MEISEKIKPVRVVHTDELYEEIFYANPQKYLTENEQLFIQYFLDSVIRPGYNYNNHDFGYHRCIIFLILEGEMCVHNADGSTKTYHKNTLVLNNDSDVPGTHNFWQVTGKDICKRYCITIQKNPFLENMIMRFFSASCTAVILQKPEKIRRIFEEILHIIQEDYSETALLTGKLIQLFCEAALQKRKKEYPQVLQKAVFYIQENFSHPDIDRKNIAMAAKTSIRTLNRVFLRYLNTTPSAFLQDCRLRKARTLLECSGLSIKEIAEECGFASAGYFTKWFHAVYGCSPRSFRER